MPHAIYILRNNRFSTQPEVCLCIAFGFIAYFSAQPTKQPWYPGGREIVQRTSVTGLSQTYGSYFFIKKSVVF